MPINNFHGETFVAFTDISGFKQLMKDGNRALRALDMFYKYGYRVIKESIQQSSIRVEGIFISDSGILFVRNCQYEIERLKTLLKVIKKLNKKMLIHDLMLTTTIAYGNFKYQERIEFEGIEKNAIYGNAYVSAFLDNENGKPKIRPGQCRIVKGNLPQRIIQSIERNSHDEVLSMIKRRNKDNNHYYFYWMVKNESEIEDFEKEFKDFYNLIYAGMLKALKKYSQ